MFVIEKLELNKIEYVERCSLAAHGEIIQTSFNNEVVVGMRTFYNSPTGGAEALMIFGDDENGLMMSLDDIGNPPAIIATKLVRIVATSIAPFNPNTQQPGGGLLQLPSGAVFARTQIVLAGPINQPAYVCLKPDARMKAGECHQYLPLVNLRGLSRSFALELIPEPFFVSAL